MDGIEPSSQTWRRHEKGKGKVIGRSGYRHPPSWPRVPFGSGTTPTQAVAFPMLSGSLFAERAAHSSGRVCGEAFRSTITSPFRLRAECGYYSEAHQGHERATADRP